MVLLILALGTVVVLVMAAAWIDFKARRRGVRYTVDQRAARDERRKNEADLDMRSGQQLRGYGGGGI